MNTEKFMYGFGVVSLLTWALHFTISFGEYSTYKIVTAAIFFALALTIYYIFVYIYFNLKRGEIIVSVGLIFTVLLVILSIAYGDKFGKNLPDYFSFG